MEINWNVLYSLDLLAIVVFLFSYYFDCYRHGFRIDIWHSQLFLWCVLPNMLMLPFAKSELNVLVLGADLQPVISTIPKVFLLTLLGYGAILFGGICWRFNVGIGLRKAATKLIDIVPNASMMLMSSRYVLLGQAVICVVLQLSILIFYFSQNGFGFDLRKFTFANPALRPVALLISTYSVCIASHCLARYLDKKEEILLFATLFLTVGLIFFGSRGTLFAIYLDVLICYLMRLGNRVSLFRIAAVAGFFIIIAFYLGNAREGLFSVTEFFSAFAMLLLYGNNFSDLRDFAWVYSAWDHVYWGGKTYLAAVTSFVPRFASGFRDTWGMGVATARTVGFDPEIHPGLRPGAFGEAYFNFGIIGIIGIGIVLGVVLRRIDTDVKHALASSPTPMMKAFSSTRLLGVVGVLAVTAGFSEIYVLAGIYFVSWILVLTLRALRLQ